MEAQTCNLSPQEVETGELMQVQNQTELDREEQVIQDFIARPFL